MEYKDYYKILGLDKQASQSDIKKAFRKLAVKYHPDKNPGDKKSEEKFKEINEANEVLSDPEKKKKYDTLGENWQQYEQHGDAGSRRSSRESHAGGNFGAQGFEGEAGDFSDFFESIFGAGSSAFGQARTRSRRPVQGQDVQAEMEVTLEEAYKGNTRQILLNDQKINLKLKPGISEGQILRMKGKGIAGSNGGANGNLLITVHVAAHPRFERKGNDLYFDTEIDVYTAMLGGKVAVEAIDKSVQMNIPAGTDSDRTFRLKGMGMPLYDDPETHGNAYVRIIIKVPRKISPKEKELLMQLMELKNGKTA